MKKTWFFVGIFFLLLVLTAVVFYAKSKAPSVAPPAAFVTPAPIHPSTMPQPISGGPIVYSGEPAVSFPKSVPYYTVVRQRNFETERARLFALYNITAVSDTIVGSKGRYTSFSQSGKTGTISENPLTFAFHSALPSNRLVTNNINTYLTTVTENLTGLSVLPEGFTPTVSGQQYLSFEEPHPTELTGPERALVVKLDLTASKDGLPIFVNDADTPIFSASFNGDDALIELRGFILPDISKSGQDIAIISYEEAVRRLKNDAGVFSSVSLSASGNKKFMTGELPDAIQIKKVTLGYLYAAGQEYLVPVFVFTGEAREPGGNAVLRTTTIVSAL